MTEMIVAAFDSTFSRGSGRPGFSKTPGYLLLTSRAIPRTSLPTENIGHVSPNIRAAFGAG